ncbi:MAG: beta-phosphoglucomutase [Bacteroidota bacterium]
MSKKIKALIFDLDGILVSTEHNHFIAWKNTAKVLGISFDKYDNEQLKGISRADSLKKILALGNKTISEQYFNELLTKKNDFYLNSIQTLNQENVLPGVLNLLKKAQEFGLKCAVGSSSKNARFILTKLDIDRYFNVIVDGSDVSHPKPHPEVFIKGAELMGVDPAECIVFEDAQSGIQAAKAGGFLAIGVGNPALIDQATYYLTTLNEFILEEYA